MLVLNESFEIFKEHCKYTVLSHNPENYCSLNGMECVQKNCTRVQQQLEPPPKPVVEAKIRIGL
jgi:hypothetical protein